MSAQNFTSDVRYAVRMLARSPLTVLVTVLSLGVGLGAVATVFTVADGVLHPPAPWLRDPGRLVTLYTSDEDGEAYGSTSFADFEDLRSANALAGVAAATVKLLSIDEDGDTRPVLAEVVSGNYFALTGIRPILGRAFAPEEGAIDADASVGIIGFGLWKDRFGADPAIVGRTLRVNGRPLTVVGVAPEGVLSRRVAVPVRPDIWVPLGAPQVRRTEEVLRARGSRDYAVLGRLRDGADIATLRVQLSVIGDRLARDDPEAWTDEHGRLRAFSAVAERDSRMNPGARTALAGVAVFFYAVAGLILLIACANVTSLFLVRAVRRGREVALRLALGAKRIQIVRMLFAEGLLLGLAAGLLGLGVAEAAMAALRSLSLPINVPIRLDLDPGARVYVFVFAVALVTSAIFSMLPAWRVSRAALVPALKEGRTSWGRPGGKLRPGSVLVSVQFAAALVLVVGAGLFLRSLDRATHLDLGLDPSGIAVTTKSVPEALRLEDAAPFYQEMVARVAAAPGATGAALSSGLELTFLQMNGGVAVRTGAPGEPEGGRSAFRNAVTPGYLELLHVPILRGRSLVEGDREGAAPVAVVNETFARSYWPGEDALGRSFTLVDRSPRAEATKPRVVQVVGVAEDGRYIDVDDPPSPYVWTSLYQDPSRTVTVVVKGASAEAMVLALRARVDLAPGETPVLPPATYESQLSIQFIHLRVVSKMLGWGGAFGLFLALIGVYGLVSFAVAQRTREIAIRRAVGAGGAQVVGSMVRHGLWHALTGLAVGLLVLVPCARLLRGVLVGVGPADPVSMLAGIALLLVTATLASLVPARRAARIDPMVSLRQE